MRRPSGIWDRARAQRPAAPCLADHRHAGHRQGDAGLSPCARAARGPGAGRRAWPSTPLIPVFRRIAAGTHAGLMTVERSAGREDQAYAARHRRRRGPRGHAVPQAHGGRRRLARRRRRWRGGHEPQRRQCAAQAAGGAAHRRPAAAGVPRARACCLPTIRSRCRRLRLWRRSSPEPRSRHCSRATVPELPPDRARADGGARPRARSAGPSTLAAGEGPAMAAQVARVVATIPKGLAALEVADAIGARRGRLQPVHGSPPPGDRTAPCGKARAARRTAIRPNLLQPAFH